MKALILLAKITNLIMCCFLFGCTIQELSKELDEEEGLPDSSLKEGTFDPVTNTYDFQFKFGSYSGVIDAPDNTDYQRGAMAHDGTTANLYYFTTDNSGTLLWFQLEDSLALQEGGDVRVFKPHPEHPVVPVQEAPEDADFSSFTVAHDTATYRMYVLSKTSLKLYQFAYDPEKKAFVYGFRSGAYSDIEIKTTPGDATALPDDLDLTRWSLYNDGTSGIEGFWLYIGKQETDELYPFNFYIESSDYGYAYKPEVQNINLINLPESTVGSNFMMMHDKTENRDLQFSRTLSDAGYDDAEDFVGWLTDFITNNTDIEL